MKRFAKMLMATGLAVASLPALALDIAQGARVGVGGGRYSGEANTSLSDPGGNPIAVNCAAIGSNQVGPNECGLKSVTGTYGGEFGYTLNLADFYADLGLNMLRTKSGDEDLWRTDLLFTVGYYLSENWSLFAGLRRGWQGDGIFNDDVFEEIGPYVGLGFGGIPIGSWATLNMSAAYNFDKVKNFPNDDSDLDYPGISLKFGMNFKNTPHSLQLRLQRFSGDDSLRISPADPDCPSCRVDFDLEETWAVLSYVFTLAW
jgi:hypothetical protein